MPVTTDDKWEILTFENAEDLYTKYFNERNGNRYYIINCDGKSKGKYYFLAKFKDKKNKTDGFDIIICNDCIDPKLPTDKQIQKLDEITGLSTDHRSRSKLANKHTYSQLQEKEKGIIEGLKSVYNNTHHPGSRRNEHNPQQQQLSSPLYLKCDSKQFTIFLEEFWKYSDASPQAIDLAKTYQQENNACSNVILCSVCNTDLLVHGKFYFVGEWEFDNSRVVLVSNQKTGYFNRISNDRNLNLVCDEGKPLMNEYFRQAIAQSYSQQPLGDTSEPPPPPPPNLLTEIPENDSTTQAVNPPKEWNTVSQPEIEKIYKKLHNYELWGPVDLVWTTPIYITHKSGNNLLLRNGGYSFASSGKKDVKKVNLSESYVLHGIKLAYEGDWYESGNDQENTKSTILKGKKCSSKESRRNKNGKWKPSDLIKALTDAKGLLENLYKNNNLIGKKQVKTLNDVFENLKKGLSKKEFLENVAEFFKDRKIYVNGIINSSGLIKSSSLVKKQLTESEFKAFQIKHFTRSFSERFIQQWFWIIGSYTNLLYEKIIKIEDSIEYSIKENKKYNKEEIENEFETKLNACDKKFDNAVKKLLQRKNRKDHEASITSSAARKQLLECWNYLFAINNIIKKSDYSLYQEKKCLTTTHPNLSVVS